MKILFGLVSILCLVTFSVGCDRNQSRDDIQREEPIRGDDIRENDSYDRSVPLEQEEVDPNIEIMDVEPDEGTVSE